MPSGRPPKSGCFKTSVTKCHNAVWISVSAASHVASLNNHKQSHVVHERSFNLHQNVTVNHSVDISFPISGQMPQKSCDLFQTIQVAYKKFLRFFGILFGPAVPYYSEIYLMRLKDYHAERSLPHLLPKAFHRYLWEKYLFIDLIFLRGQCWPMPRDVFIKNVLNLRITLKPTPRDSNPSSD